MTTLTHAEVRQEAELARTRARCNAFNQNVFTLEFVGGQVALLDVRGAANVEEARSIAQNAIKNCEYMVVDGDQTEGQAHSFSLWCSAAAQEMQPHSHRPNEKKEEHTCHSHSI